MSWSVVAVASPRYCTFYRALTGRTAELLAALEGPDYDRATFERVRASRPAAKLGRAVRFLVVNRMSRCEARQFIRANDGRDTLHYCDPPYLPSTRTARDAYRHELAEADHRALLGVLRECRGAVVLSGYPSPLYDGLLPGWEWVAFDMPNHAGQPKPG